MGYSGETYSIPCSSGGLNHNNNVDMIPPEAMLDPSRNLNLNEGGRGKRGGTAHVNSTVISGTPQIWGVSQFRLTNGNSFILNVTNDGKIYKGYDVTLKTGLAINQLVSFETLNDIHYIVTGNSIPQTWDGLASATSDITSMPSDWTSGNYPRQIIAHGRGVSERMWAIGCPNNLNRIYASANDDGQDFSDTNVITLDIKKRGLGFGLVGLTTYGDRLIAFGKNKAYIINDLDSDTANWGYEDAQWEGGVANFNLVIKTPTDIVCMTEDGEIYSVVAAQEYGDYQLASLTNPITSNPVQRPYIQRWIQDNIKLSEIDKFHGVYDPTLRAVFIFVMRNGQTQVDTALVYFVDRQAWEAWMIHDNQSSTSGYSASCSSVVRELAGSYKVYTGGYSGFVWKLDELAKSDNSNGYYAGFKTGKLHFGDVRVSKNYKRGWLVTQAFGSHNLSIDTWVDDVAMTRQTVSLSGTGGILDSFTLDTDKLGGNELINKAFTIGNVGKRIQFEVFNSTANQDFFVSQKMVDFRFLGKKPS